MRRRGVVFSKMFVLRSMGNELVPSPVNVRTLGRALGPTEVGQTDKLCRSRSGPEVIKLFSCSTQMSMKFSPLIYVKMPTIVGILTCMSGKNSILGLSEPKKC